MNDTPVMFTVVVVLAMSAGIYFLLTTMLGRRLMAQRLRSVLGGASIRAFEKDFGDELRGSASQVLGRLGALMPLGDEDREKIQKSLRRGALESNQAFAVVVGAKVACVLLGLVIGIIVGPTLLEGPLGWMAGIGGGFLGGILLNLLPELIVARIGVRRLRLVDQGLVDAFDLLIVCLEAGLTFERALRRTTDNLAILWPQLARELRVVVTDMAVHGRSRFEALGRMAERLESQTLKDLATTVGQAERFGTPLADALRKFNSSLRVARVSRAQEKAARLPTLLVVPSILGLLPGILVIVGGPAFLQLNKTLAASPATDRLGGRLGGWGAARPAVPRPAGSAVVRAVPRAEGRAHVPRRRWEAGQRRQPFRRHGGGRIGPWPRRGGADAIQHRAHGCPAEPQVQRPVRDEDQHGLFLAGHDAHEVVAVLGRRLHFLDEALGQRRIAHGGAQIAIHDTAEEIGSRGGQHLHRGPDPTVGRAGGDAHGKRQSGTEIDECTTLGTLHVSHQVVAQFLEDHDVHHQVAPRKGAGLASYAAAAAGVKVLSRPRSARRAPGPGSSPERRRRAGRARVCRVTSDFVACRSAATGSTPSQRPACSHGGALT